MNPEQTFETIGVDRLVARVHELRAGGRRLVQISATRLSEEVELIYSFDLRGSLLNLRLSIPAVGASVPSINSIFSCAVLYENELHDLFNVQVQGMAVDFKGNLYKTKVKFPFATFKAPRAKSASAEPVRNAAPVAAPSS